MSLTMYDSIYVSQIPKDAKAVAGYTAGHWPTYFTLLREFPHAHILSIAVASKYNADCLDIERGDATNEVAAAWVKRQMARGIKRPVVYTSVSNAMTLLYVLSRAGIHRDQVKLWTAHYTGVEHLCGPRCGFHMNTVADATQYTNHALGRTLDASLLLDSFFGKEGQPGEIGKDATSYLKLVGKDGRVLYEPLTKKNIATRVGVYFVKRKKFKQIVLNRGQ